MIIDKSQSLAGTEVYEYQVVGSDLTIFVRTDFVYFCDLHHDREEPDFKLAFSEFITFMKDFKKFIKENR